MRITNIKVIVVAMGIETGGQGSGEMFQVAPRDRI